MDSSANTLSQRDRDFIDACRRVIAAPGSRRLTAAQIAVRAAASPAPSFYITYEYALRHFNIPYPNRTSAALRMEEIRRRTRLLSAIRGISYSEALANVLADTSPRGFFLSDSSAVRLYHRLRGHLPRRRPLNNNKDTNLTLS